MKKNLFLLAVCISALVLVNCGRDFSRFPSKGSYNVSLTSVEPNEGSNDADIPIVLRGSNFIGAPRVLVGATDCGQVEVVTAKLITAVIPAEIPAGLFDVTLIAPNDETTSLSNAFTIIDPTRIAVYSITPES
ncbi:unnamed protein product, partial [marine sediment metagenome]